VISVEVSALLDCLGSQALAYMHNAAGLCVSMTNHEVAVEHFVLKALEDPASDVSLLLRQTGQETPNWHAALTADLESKTKGASDKPVFSPLLLELLQDSWLSASLELKLQHVRTGAILLALTTSPSRYMSGETARLARSLPREAVLQAFPVVARASTEEQAAPPNEAGAPAAQREGSFIARYCKDFIVEARAGRLDPVFGRDEEIRQMVDILARRRKNNPILVGEPGVGKTALIEGLAMRIVAGDVPKELEGVSLLGLDMGSLEAGAGMKGEFENRLKGVIDDIKASPTPIILFIDEAHTLIGAGGGAGTSDAANLLKPALARGELRTCAATTWKEYKKYFEKDAALSRRFQLVSLAEPSVEVTRLILLGLKESYENAHGVLVSDAAIAAIADYSDRYISGRFQPDKSVDLLDTACARVKVLLAARPAQMEDSIRKVEGLARHIASLVRDKESLLPINEELLDDLRKQKALAGEESEQLEKIWREEQEVVQAVLAARQTIYDLRRASETANGAQGVEAPGDGVEPVSDALASPPADLTPAGAEIPVPGVGEASSPTASPEPEDPHEVLARATERLKTLQEKGPMLFAEVGPDVIAKVVSDWTGIPLGRVGRDQADMIAHLQENLSRRIEGQDFALRELAQGIQVAKAGLKEVNRPLGVFLLTGPSGTGKTETALALAEQLFGSDANLVTLNMGEFQESHTVSRLIGSPPGYVGFGEGGLLTEAVRQKPYSVVLLDEVEKAHPDIMNLFYQVFDTGVLQDSEGKEVRFRNAVILLTSNLCSDTIDRFWREKQSEGVPGDMDELVKAMRPELNARFKPALVARMTVLPYVPLSDAALARIVSLKLNRIAERLREESHVLLTWSDALEQSIVNRCTEVETGARNIEYILNRHILPTLSRELLKSMATQDRQEGVARQTSVQLDMDAAGQCVVAIT
jgi:type VI secretion system protein VasG